MLWLQFGFSALLIVLAGTRLVKNAERIAGWTGLSTAWAGAFLLPLVTSLPELINSWRAAVISAPDLCAGNLLGSNVFNFLIIAIIDLRQGHGPLTRHLQLGHILTAVFVIILSCVAVLGIALPGGPSIGWVGWPSLLLVFFYIFGTFLLLRFEKKTFISVSTPGSQKSSSAGRLRLARDLLEFVLAGTVIVLAMIVLTDTADILAIQTGLGRTFIGSILIAATTSLPEIVTTYTAARLGLFDMAVANVFGANFLNLALLSISDFFYRKGPLFYDLSPNHLFTAVIGIVLVCIFIFGLVYRSSKSFARLGYDSLLIVLGYIAAFLILFFTRVH